MTTTADQVWERAKAEIAAAGRATLERREREKYDARLQSLTSYAESLQQPLDDGFAGGQQMFLNLSSSQHWRRLRAESLAIVRKQQLFGHRPSVRFWLAKAAEQRKSERHYRTTERRMSNVNPVFASALAPFLAAAE